MGRVDPTTTTTAPRDAAGVADLLARAGRSFAGPRLIGAELEMAVVRQADLSPAPYGGSRGIGALLERVQACESGFRLEREGEHVIGLSGPDGGTISLEPGGQFEISTAPHPTLAALDADLRRKTACVARLADDLGLYLLAGGMTPASQEAMPWMPKGRYRIMHEYFAGLGQGGRLHQVMMQRTLSTQVSVDYAGAADAAELLRLAFLAAPVATAIFANSPLDGTLEDGILSHRAEAWLWTDPGRTGLPSACARPGASLLDFADYAVDVPAMFRVDAEGGYHAMNGASFREALARGAWSDGAPVTEPSVWQHLNGVFTDARLKKGLVETRSTDGQSPDELTTVPAFWTGLLYDDAARADAAALLDDVGVPALQDAARAVPREALRAACGARSMLEVARDLVAVARAGLERRVERGEEEPGATDYLAPVEARVAAGRTPAEELLARWSGDWGRDLRRLVEAVRFRPAEPCAGA